MWGSDLPSGSEKRGRDQAEDERSRGQPLQAAKTKLRDSKTLN